MYKYTKIVIKLPVSVDCCYTAIIFPLCDNKEIEQILKDLIDYCNQYTFGMIIVLEESERVG